MVVVFENAVEKLMGKDVDLEEHKALLKTSLFFW